MKALIAWLRRRWRRLVDPQGRRPRFVLLAACAVIVTMYCTNQDMGKQPDAPRGDGVYRPVLARGDGHMMYLMARSTALDGDWIYDNDLARFGDPWRQRITPTGRKAIVNPIGPALLWTPLIWIAQGGAVVANLVGADIALHGYTLWHHRFVFLSSALFACGAVLLGAALARRLLGGTWSATYAAVAILLGSSLTYYATYMPSYSHAMDAMACAGFLFYWAITVGRTDRRRWIVLGVLLGVAALIRVQELAMGVVVALEVCVETVRRRQWRAVWPWWLGGAAALAVALIVFVPQLLEWRIVFGSFAGLPQGARFTRLEAPLIGELLFSARNGWFSTTPIAYAGALGLLCLPRRVWLVGAGLIAAVAIQIYLNSVIFDWWASAAFGQRRMCNVTLPLVVGLACLIWRCGQLAQRLPVAARHAIAVGILGVFIAWNLMRVGPLRGGVAATESLIPTCCDRVPRPLRGAAAWIYRRIGNPFELPASAWFAWRHGVPLDRWDQAVGNYPLVPPLDSLIDDQLWAQRGAWRIGSGLDPYLVSGWSRSVRPPGDRPLRWTTAPSATVLVPNLMPYGQRLTLWLAPAGARRATVRWNGAVVAEAELSGWTPVRFDVPDMPARVHELTIESVPGPYVPATGAAAVPAPPGPVGVAVGDLELAFLRP